jgi:Tfp pilus assembly protein PilN
MIKINLLSPLDKENLKWEKINNLLTQSIFWIISVVVFFVAIFFFSLEYLQVEESNVSDRLVDIQKQQDTQEVLSIENSMKAFKGKINNIYSIEKSHLSWTFLLENLAVLIPDGVRLDSVSVDPVAAAAKSTDDSLAAKDKTGDYKITITGNAKTRDDLLALEGNLKKTGLFTNLEYDDSNYVQSVDINFSYVFYINKDKLLK